MGRNHQVKSPRSRGTDNDCADKFSSSKTSVLPQTASREGGGMSPRQATLGTALPTGSQYWGPMLTSLEAQAHRDPGMARLLRAQRTNGK